MILQNSRHLSPGRVVDKDSLGKVLSETSLPWYNGE